MAIITVSRQVYSYGDEIAKKVADDLGFEFIDKQKIGEALANLGLPASETERFDEKKPSIWDALATQKNKFLYLMKAAIYEFAKTDQTLILGRGAQVLLNDLPGTLHLRIVAPSQVRLKRMMAQEKYDEKIAERVLRQKDRDSFGYIRAFFNADWNDNYYYDMVINTKVISISTATEMIATTIRSAELKSDSDGRAEKLAALSLEQKAEAAIMDIQKGNNIYVAVTNVEKGTITLRGATDSEATRDDCGLAISKIKGVEDIINEVTIVKAMYR